VNAHAAVDRETRTWVPMRQVDVKRVPGEGLTVRVFENDLYRASLYERTGGGSSYLSILRHDEGAAHDWRHFQTIKNETAGPEREAVELYPAESRLIDEANAYHLFLAPEGERFPFGATERSVVRPGEHQPGGAFSQRAWQSGLSTG
jgi:hypothetical protein